MWEMNGGGETNVASVTCRWYLSERPTCGMARESHTVKESMQGCDANDMLHALRTLRDQLICAYSTAAASTTAAKHGLHVSVAPPFACNRIRESILSLGLCRAGGQ
jgi:hypothetical protein